LIEKLKEKCKDLNELLDLIEISYFEGEYKGWNRNSFYPSVEITSLLGKQGDIEIESQALLVEHNVY